MTRNTSGNLYPSRTVDIKNHFLSPVSHQCCPRCECECECECEMNIALSNFFVAECLLSLNPMESERKATKCSKMQQHV